MVTVNDPYVTTILHFIYLLPLLGEGFGTPHGGGVLAVSKKSKSGYLAGGKVSRTCPKTSEIQTARETINEANKFPVTKAIIDQN